MITINGTPTTEGLLDGYESGGIENSVAGIMEASRVVYDFVSPDELRFQLGLRRAIVDAAEALRHSGLDFRIFREAYCNPDYWTLKSDGGFEKKTSVLSSAAIGDIYANGRKYGTECATAMQIVYYKALLSVMPQSKFNSEFKDIRLMNWSISDPRLAATGLLIPAQDYFPGDRRYINNPDVDPKTPQWQGENVIDMGDGTYYGHGMGRHDAEYIIKALNRNRKRGAEEPAYMMLSAGRPDFKLLYDLFGKPGTLMSA